MASSFFLEPPLKKQNTGKINFHNPFYLNQHIHNIIISSWNQYEIGRKYFISIFSACPWNPVCLLRWQHIEFQTSDISSVHLGGVAVLLNREKWHLFWVAIGMHPEARIPVSDIAAGRLWSLLWDYQKRRPSIHENGQAGREENFPQPLWTWSTMRARTELVLLALFLMTGTVPDSGRKGRTIDEMNNITLSEIVLRCFFFIPDLQVVVCVSHWQHRIPVHATPTLCAQQPMWLVALGLDSTGIDGWDLRLILLPT